MRGFSLIIAIVVVSLLTACDGPAQFSSPLSAPPNSANEAMGSTFEDFERRYAALIEGVEGVWFAPINGSGGAFDLAIIEIKSPRSGFGEPLEEHVYRLSGKLLFLEDGKITQRWHGIGYPSEISGQIYFNIQPVAFSVPECDAVFEEHVPNCSFDLQGYIFATGGLDESGHLWLDFLSESAALRHNLKSRRLDCGEECSYLVFDPTSDELQELVRSVPHDEIFDIHFGNLTRIEGPPMILEAPKGRRWK